MRFGKHLLAILFVSQVLSTGNTEAAPVYSFSMEAPGLYYASTNMFVHSRPTSEISNFWSFCQPYNCYGYGMPNVEPRKYLSTGTRFDEPGSVLAQQLNLAFNGYIDVAVGADAAAPGNLNEIGKYVYNFSSDPSKLLSISADEAIGIAFIDYVGLYVLPNREGVNSIRISGIYDQTSAPYGYISNVSTEVVVSFYANWLDEQGQPDYISQEVYRNAFNGTSDILLELPRNLNDFPSASRAAYGSYNIAVLNKFTFAREVPEPSTVFLISLGLLLIGASLKGRLILGSNGS